MCQSCQTQSEHAYCMPREGGSCMPCVLLDAEQCQCPSLADGVTLGRGLPFFSVGNWHGVSPQKVWMLVKTQNIMMM